MEFPDLKKEIDTLAQYFMRGAKNSSYSKEIPELKGNVMSCDDYYVCRSCDADLVIAHMKKSAYSDVEWVNMGDYVFLKIYSTYEEDEPLLIGKLPILTRLTLDDFLSDNDQYHVLTYAEEGFAPLNQHSRSAGITKDQLVIFAAGVNSRCEIGTLHPLAAISAIPRSFVREPDPANTQTLVDQITKFLRLNEETIKATRIAFDFRTPSVENFIFTAIEKSMSNNAGSTLLRAIVIV